MNIIHRLTLTTALAAAIASASTVGHAAPKEGGTLVIGSTSTPRHFNGAIQSGIATAVPSTQIFASPLRYDDQWNPHPYLAKSWEVSKDGLTVTLHLVENAKFHDETPVTSEDVKFSIETIKKNHPFKTMLQPVTSVETPDAHTVVIHFDHPHPAFLLAMSPALMPILPEHVYGQGDIKTNPANLKPVGSGPFEFDTYKQGEYIKLKKFDDFFIKGKPHLDNIVIQIIGDENNLMLSTERGDIDMVPFLSAVRDIERLKKDDNLVVTDAGYDAIGPINWLAFNTRKQPLDKVEVRQAIAYAVDRDFIVKKLLGGFAPEATGPIVPESPFYSGDVDKFSVDIHKANQMLDDAGLKKGSDGSRFSLTVDYIPGDPEQQRNIAEYLRSQLRRVGITVNVRSAPDFPTWAQRISSYDFDMTMDNVYNWGDPIIGVDRTYISSNIRPNVIWSNTQQYSNPKVDELLETAATETDPEKRAELYKEFQNIVVGDVPIYFLNETPMYTVYKKGLKNAPTSIWGAASPLDDVYWDDGSN